MFVRTGRNRERQLATVRGAHQTPFYVVARECEKRINGLIRERAKDCARAARGKTPATRRAANGDFVGWETLPMPSGSKPDSAQTHGSRTPPGLRSWMQEALSVLGHGQSRWRCLLMRVLLQMLLGAEQF